MTVDYSPAESLSTHAAQFELSTSDTAPDGNIFINFATGEISIFDNGDVAEIRPGVANPIGPGNDGGVTMAALLYYFQFLFKNSNEHRRYKAQADINFIDANAYALLNGYHIKEAHITRVKNSGIELKPGDIASITTDYFIGVSTGGLEPDHTAYRRFGDGVPADEVTGNFNNLVRVPQSARENRDDLVYFLRVHGYEPQRAALTDIALLRSGGFTVPIGIRSNRYERWDMGWLQDIAAGTGDFANLRAILDSPARTVTGLGGDGSASGDFSFIIENPDSISLDKITAWILYHQNQDSLFIYGYDQSLIPSLEGRRLPMLYELDGDNVKFGQLHAGGTPYGIYVENLDTIDKTRITQTTDDGVELIYPFLTQVNIDFTTGIDLDGLPQNEKDNFWFGLYLASSYNTDTAVLMSDIDGQDVTGNYTDLVSGVYSYNISYDFDTSGGTPAATDKEVVLRAGGRTIKQKEARAVMTRQSKITINARLEQLQS